MDVILLLWERHAERLMFMVLALVLSVVMYKIGWKDEAQVIIIGIAMLCFNKSRAPDKQVVYKEKPKDPEVSDEAGTV